MFLSIKHTMTEMYAQRWEKQVVVWAEAVSRRRTCVGELPAVEAICYRRCFQWLMHHWNLHLDSLSVAIDEAPVKTRGCPKGSPAEHAFMHIIECLENNDELYATMVNLSNVHVVHSKRCIQSHVYAYYSDRFAITSSMQQLLIFALTANTTLIQNVQSNVHR